MTEDTVTYFNSLSPEEQVEFADVNGLPWVLAGDRLLFFRAMTLEETGDLMQITRERVRQIQVRTLPKLKQKILGERLLSRVHCQKQKSRRPEAP